MSASLEVVKGGGDLAVRSTDHLSNIQRLGNILAASGYFSDIRDMAQAAVKVMAGEELGISPVASVMGIHIIKGKVTLSANLIAAQVRRHGYNFRHLQFDNKGCSLEFTGKSGEVLGVSSFTEEDAKTAGVYSDMYRKFPRNMYFSRAISNGAKWFCPEATCGLPVYVPEELGAKVNGDGEVVVEESIDTGGHPVGTQAAANHVAEQKLEELRRQNAAPRNVVQQPSGPAKVAEPVPAHIQAVWARMRDIKSTIEVFAELKRDLCESFGQDSGERFYYGMLGKHGVEHANQFKSTKPARAAAQEMLDAISASQRPPAVEDDAVPEFDEASR